MDEDPVLVRSSGWTWIIVGAVCAGLPMVVRYESSSVNTVNGEVVAAVYRDWVAVVGGAGALAFGLLGLLGTRTGAATPRETRTTRLAIALVVMAFGGFQVARGLGLLMSPVGTTTTTSHDWTPSPGPEPSDPAHDPIHCPDGPACFALGTELEAQHSPNAAIAFGSGCEKSHPQSCSKLADQRIRDKNFAGAVQALEQACAGGLGDACMDAGVYLSDGSVGSKDLARAAKLFVRACAAKSKHGCYDLGITYRDGLGVPVELAKAHQAFEQSCALEDAEGCDQQAIAVYQGRGIAKDAPGALPLFEKACKLSDERCFNLGVMYDEGVVVKRDAAKAAELWQRACDHQMSMACFNLGIAAQKGDGLAKNAAKARAYFEAACDADYFDGCNNLGNMWEQGTGGAKDLGHAKQLFEKACKGGLALGCKNLETAR
jgi:TPR repeat protein